MANENTPQDLTKIPKNGRLRVPAIRIKQPFGEFFVCSIKASILLDITYPDALRASVKAPTDPDKLGFFSFEGSQRKQDDKRQQEITDFINSDESTFPNSIILCANVKDDDSYMEEDEDRWVVSTNSKFPGLYELDIPLSFKTARVIDGQHRLLGFVNAKSKRKEMELLCAVFFELPHPFQAYLFATINFNQRAVNKSLAYQLFAINLREVDRPYWSPEKLAVHLSRILATDDKSPFKERIVIAAQNDEMLLGIDRKAMEMRFSTATIVDGILSLISKKPKQDRSLIHQTALKPKRRDKVLVDDGTPLRKLFLETNDRPIYDAIVNYFSVVEDVIWSVTDDSSYLRKTIGIQALFSSPL